ncbi:MAG TPA: DHH family phosphoesterase [Bacilli bacterium]|nr:DHH family phosphoesterase [Bacilli bacterium]HQA55506.1 DHH family phosphoesterase [Bacilli bacterium]
MNDKLFEKLLNYYHIDMEGYKSITSPVDESNFALGHSFDHIEEAVALVKEVMSHNGKILIYGDYDADGVMGTSVLVKMFKYVSYPVEYYLPNRYEDGYGLTIKKAQEAIENDIELVITVDNGISAFEPIEILKSKGVKVLIIDHHQAQEILPLADFIIHPILSHFGEVPSSGAFTAFMFSLAFLKRFDKYLSTLAAISLVSDIMPLVSYNRNLLRMVIANYHDREFFQIDALKEDEPFNETTIGLKIAPKINAIGRLIDGDDINRLVAFFTEGDKSQLLSYISWINEVNESRKTASKSASDSLDHYSPDEPAIVHVTDAKEGLLGLIANQLVNKYQVPCIVLTKDKSGDLLKGSCRAPEGFNVVEAFQTLSKYLLAYGGHASAGGCTLDSKNFEIFKAEFIKLVKATPLQKVKKDQISIGITDINEDSYRIIQAFSPFGESWPAPLLSLKRVDTSSLFFSRDEKHILTQIGHSTRLTGFNFPRSEVQQHRFIDLTGHLRINTYRGFKNIEFLISEISSSDKS